jgi:hypothetical protein
MESRQLAELIFDSSLSLVSEQKLIWAEKYSTFCEKSSSKIEPFAEFAR